MSDQFAIPGLEPARLPPKELPRSTRPLAVLQARVFNLEMDVALLRALLEKEKRHVD